MTAKKPGYTDSEIKERKFARAFVECGSKATAYRQVYGDDEYATDNAYRISKRPHVAEYIEELMAMHAKRHCITVDHLLEQLEEARLTALSSFIPQTSAAVAAILGKAKILGLDKQVLELTGKDGAPLDVTVNFVKPKGD